MKKNIIFIAVLIVLLVFVVIIRTDMPHNTNNISTDPLIHALDNTSIRTDVEPLATHFPWLDILSCQWKAVVMGDNDIPGPTDIIICGYLVVSETYLTQLQDGYEWIEYEIQINMLPDGISEDDINLVFSADYKTFYTSLQIGASVNMYPDFTNKIIYFSGNGSV